MSPNRKTAMKTVLYSHPTPNLRYSAGFHYADGEAETFLDTDLMDCESEFVPPDGKSSVLLKNSKNQTREAVCYSWTDKYKTKRGLVVFPDDQDAVRHAERSMAGEFDN